MSVKTAAALIFTTFALAGCGRPHVELRPSAGCDGGNLEDCATKCNDNVGRACYRLGWFYEENLEVKGSMRKSLEHYDQACNANFAVACRALGHLYWRGQRIDRNRKKALTYYDRACALGLPEACPTKDMLRVASGKKSGGADGDASFGFDVSVEGPDEPDAPKVNKPKNPDVPDAEVPAIEVP